MNKCQLPSCWLTLSSRAFIQLWQALLNVSAPCLWSVSKTGARWGKEVELACWGLAVDYSHCNCSEMELHPSQQAAQLETNPNISNEPQGAVEKKKEREKKAKKSKKIPASPASTSTAVSMQLLKQLFNYLDRREKLGQFFLAWKERGEGLRSH